MEAGGSSSSSNNGDNNNNNYNNNKNDKGKAPATEATAGCSSKQTTPPRTSSLPPIPPSSCQVREQDRYMPIANVVRIMRRAIPPNGKISDEAKETVQECVTEFISFITEEANQKCHEDHRKTVTGDDLLWAMSRLGFDNYAAVLKSYLERYREVETLGLPQHEIATRQRRIANRSDGIQIEISSSPQPIPRPGPIAWRTGVSIRPSPAVMPPIAMVDPPQSRLRPVGNQGYFNNDGSGSSSGPNVSFNSSEGGYVSSLNPAPPGPRSIMSFSAGASNNNEEHDSTPTSAEAEISFVDLITNFK